MLSVSNQLAIEETIKKLCEQEYIKSSFTVSVSGGEVTFETPLSEDIEYLEEQIEELQTEIDAKDQIIRELEEHIDELEAAST